VEGVKHCKKCGEIQIGARCKPCAKAWHAAYRDTHREEKQAYDRAHQKANPGQCRANSAKRRARKLKACPKWLTKEHHKEMDQTHDNCPKGSHVDHIIPLKSRIVQGLHVPWNLQHLTAQENRAKSNKCDGTYDNNGWRKLK